MLLPIREVGHVLGKLILKLKQVHNWNFGFVLVCPVIGCFWGFCELLDYFLYKRA
jgi:hypothetical protein